MDPNLYLSAQIQHQFMPHRKQNHSRSNSTSTSNSNSNSNKPTQLQSVLQPDFQQRSQQHSQQNQQIPRNRNNNSHNQNKNQTSDHVREKLISIATSNGYLMKSNDRPHLPTSTLVGYDQSTIKTCFAIKGTKIEFISLKSDKAAFYCIRSGSHKVVIMNFANRLKHGGGYLNGARAQEEDLCRVIPALYNSLKKVVYPYDRDSVIVTDNLTIMRDSGSDNGNDYAFLSKDDQINVGIVSVAAQNLKHEQFDEACVRRTLANMYCSVKNLLPDTDTLILGAWGCGAFGNDPIIMSTIMNEVNLMYGGYFKRIVFSVPVGVNHDEFKNTILQTI